MTIMTKPRYFVRYLSLNNKSLKLLESNNVLFMFETINKKTLKMIYRKNSKYFKDKIPLLMNTHYAKMIAVWPKSSFVEITKEDFLKFIISNSNEFGLYTFDESGINTGTPYYE